MQYEPECDKSNKYAMTGTEAIRIQIKPSGMIIQCDGRSLADGELHL